MYISANSINIPSEKIDFLNKEEKMNSQVSDPSKNNFGNDEANSSSNHSTNFNNYKDDSFSSDCEEEDLSDLEDFDADMLDQEYAQCGSKSKTIKKHAVHGKKNSSKFISIPQKFQMVNGEKFNLKLSNKLDNRLEMKNNRKEKIAMKSTFTLEVDENSNNLLSKMLQNQALEKISGVIRKCKEYTMFQACIGPNFPSKPNLPKKCIIKVYTPLYVGKPPQYRWQAPRPMGMAEKKISQTEAEDRAKKEFATLVKFTAAHVPCSKGIIRNKNILFLTFIGKNTLSQCLEAGVLRDNECDIVYNKVLKLMRILFQELHLILVDLSPSNILWHDNECYLTDVINYINCNEAYAFKSLLSICSRIESYFSKTGLPVTSNEIFRFVTDCEYGDRVS